MTRQQLEARRAYVAELSHSLSCIVIACASCEHWESETCQKFQSTPPREVRVIGCAEWELAEFPF